MDSDLPVGESEPVEQMAQFDPEQQQMVFLSPDGNSYILPSQSGADGDGLVTYIYGGDGVGTDAAGELQGADSDIQYLLVSADEASGMDQGQFVMLPQSVEQAPESVTQTPESVEQAPESGVDSVEQKTSPGKQIKVVSSGIKSEPVKSSTDTPTTIVITPSANDSAGTTAEVKVKGGTARVTILPAPNKSPMKGTASTSAGVTTIPIRFVSRSESGSASLMQTISLPVKSAPKVTVSVKSTPSSLPPAIVSLPKVTVVPAPATPSSPKKVGRPRKDAIREEKKDPLHQLSKPGGVTKAKNANVIVVPIQISKEMIAAKQSSGSKVSKGVESSSDSEKEKDKVKNKAVGKDKDSPSKDKEATTSAAKSSVKKQATKPVEASPSLLTPRRSKRESNLSSKLAEWGLLPTSGGQRHSANEEEDSEDEEMEKEAMDEDDEEENEPLAKSVGQKSGTQTPKPAAATVSTSTVKSSASVPAKIIVATPSASSPSSTQVTKVVSVSLTSLPSVSKVATVSTPSTSTKVISVGTPPVKVSTPAVNVTSTKKFVTIAAKESENHTPIVIKPNSSVSSASKVMTPSSGILKKTPASTQSTSASSSTAPKLLQNKSLMCKPIMMTKATSCNPIRITKATQTDEECDSALGGGNGSKNIVPLPVPIFVPAPMAMFSMPTPFPVPLPLPIPVPCFIPTTRNSIAAIMKQLQELHDSLPSDPFEADMLKMAEAVAEASDEPDHSNDRKDTLIVESADAESNDMSVDVLEMALRMASETGDGDSKKSNGVYDSSRPAAKRARLSDDNLAEDEDGENSTSSALVVAEPLRGPAPAPILHAPISDAHMRLKYSYGINAWKQWVTAKNAEIEALGGQGRAGGRGASAKLFKIEILQCGSEELSIALSHFVRELRKPTGEKYSPDSVYYLCLGIQHYLFENGRIDNIFADVYYERFNEALHELLSTTEVRLNSQGLIVCRVSEEHLWEARQLGAHSPRVLLHTLVYFNTKYFMLQNAENHLALSFSNILKQWKKNTNTADGKPIRSVYLRYNTIGYSPNQPGSTPGGGLDSAIHRRRTLDPTPYEQLENVENPLRCPVKLYEFYLSKCPESIRNRNDVFYLTPEPSCVPTSPVWYSAQPLSVDLMNKMLGRIRVVREIQESQLNQAPSVVSSATGVTSAIYG